jgi:hypothetical protein
MESRRFNWAVWFGFLVSVVALLSYPLFFARFQVTRDFPWANLLLFAVAAVLVLWGVKRAFSSSTARGPKVWASVAATLSAAVLTLFLFGAFVVARQLPASHGAPRVGQKIPDFTLSNQHGKPTPLSELLTSPINGNAPRGVLLIFYRGYW